MSLDKDILSSSAIPVVIYTGSAPVRPWILWKDIETPLEKIRPGSLVEVRRREGTFVGQGFYNARARLRVRLLSQQADGRSVENILAERLRQAVVLRREVLKLDAVTTAYRLVHSEGDGLPGLVVDKLGTTLVAEFFSAGLFRQRAIIEKVLGEQFPNHGWYAFAEKRVQKQESFDLWEREAPAPFVVTENGVQFNVLIGHRKTGFFCDQRENRLALATLTAGKKVLDLCSFTGGFSLYAKKLGNAEAVVAVEQDASSIELANRNALLNAVTVNFVEADMMKWCGEDSSRFGVVVLDPAKQTRSEEGVRGALWNYAMLNEAAIRKVEPGGILVSCSCSGRISEAEFIGAIQEAAARTKRTLQIFRVTGASADHPFDVSLPESRYLKAVWARVL